MATPKDNCCLCLLAGRREPSIRWPGAPICQPCYNAQRAARDAENNQPPRMRTIGSTTDSADILTRHEERMALAEAVAAEIAAGRPPGTALH